MTENKTNANQSRLRLSRQPSVHLLLCGIAAAVRPSGVVPVTIFGLADSGVDLNEVFIPTMRIDRSSISDSGSEQFICHTATKTPYICNQKIKIHYNICCGD